MSVIQLFILQIIAHIFADYFLQNNQQAKEKNEKGFKSKFLVWHALIVFLTSLILSFQPLFGFAALGIAISHYVIDGFKNTMKQKTNWLGRNWFFIDQMLHILILFLIVLIFSKYSSIKPLIPMPLSEEILLVILAYLCCLKPANILIGKILKAGKIESIQSITKNELPNAGKLIGITERILTLTFIIIGQFAAVGFLLAAKSILRYGEKDTHKAEYVLVGTLLSFAIAILIGVFISYIVL